MTAAASTGGLGRFVLRRVAVGVATLWLISVLVFAATQALPGDTATAILGREASDPARVAEVRQELGLDRSLAAQYGSWFGGLLRGDPGTSLVSRPPRPAGEVLGPRVARSAVLLGAAAAVSVPVGIGLGVVQALRRGRLLDRSSTTAMLVVASLPEFVLGVGLIVLLGTGVFHVFPAVALIDPTRSLFAQLDRLVLPVLTLALAVVPYLSRMTRTAMVEVLESEYVEMARLKGLSPARVVLGHALPNVAGPVAAVVALVIAYLAGGVVVVEAVFQYPGVGLALLEAVRARDLMIVQDLTLLTAAVFVVVSIAGDLVTVVATPRVRAPR